MKNTFFIFAILLVFSAGLYAQTEDLSGWDIDSLFDDPLPQGDDYAADSISGTDIMDNLIMQKGLIFDASFEFMGGIAPGWNETPWFFDDEKEFSWGQSIKMRANLGMDARISQVFRAVIKFSFEVPWFKLKLGDFFFDYNLYDRIFIRAGKYNQSWGISPNYSFTNLPARVPQGGSSGESFLFKADIPAGIGGVQLLALTRADLLNGVIPGWRGIGYGGKFNLALRLADFDLGVFYQDDMPLRGFLSVKTTIGDTEIYNEWLGSYSRDPRKFSGAFNLGLARDFFGTDLGVNGELFYNAENDAFWYEPESGIREARISPFIDGWNLALNLIYRGGGKLSPRFFVQTLYAPWQRSARLVPGVRLNPFPHAELYFAVPMSLGGRDGYYYSHTPDPNDRPFSIVLLLTLKGGVRSSFN